MVNFDSDDEAENIKYEKSIQSKSKNKKNVDKDIESKKSSKNSISRV